MSLHTPKNEPIERRNDARRQHFDRRDKARFEPQHPDRRDTFERRGKQANASLLSGK